MRQRLGNWLNKACYLLILFNISSCGIKDNRAEYSDILEMEFPLEMELINQDYHGGGQDYSLTTCYTMTDSGFNSFRKQMVICNDSINDNCWILQDDLFKLKASHDGGIYYTFKLIKSFRSSLLVINEIKI